ncbi:MAG: FlgD immunoglobulin-like domain containing protein [Candidatus Zixiibacteriota bacterium]
MKRIRDMFFLLILVGSFLSPFSQSQAVTFTQLTTESAYDGAPDWSPMGNKIVFVSYRGESNCLWIYDLLADSAVQLTDFSSDREPKWSPDAARIAFQSGRSKRGWEVFTVTASGEDITQITDFSDCVAPDWSPDGEKIVYRHLDGGNYDLYSIPSSPSPGDTATRLTTDPGEDSFPEYSPDGTKIVFQYLPGVEGRRDIYVMPAEGGPYTPLTENPAEDHISPSWSPDGRWIAFTSDRAGNNDIWIMDSRGEDLGLYQITADTSDDHWPSWSPDGSRLVFCSDRSGNRDLWIASCLPTTRGDVNQDCVVDIGDVVFLISYLFRGGPPPDPLVIGDVNRDDVIDVGDVVYLVSYLYKGGPPPVCGCASHPELAGSCSRCDDAHALRKTAGSAEVNLAQREVSKRGKEFVDVDASFGTDVAGVQIELSYDPQEIKSVIPELADRTQDMKLFFGAADGILKIGIVDLTGEHVVAAGEGSLVKLRLVGANCNSVQLNKAILVDQAAAGLSVVILPKEDGEEATPRDFILSQNHPNPFNPETEISYSLPEAAQVKVSVYNMLGQKVKTLLNEYQAAGHKTINWDGTDERGNKAASGIYFYRIKAGEFEDTKKMILMK